ELFPATCEMKDRLGCDRPRACDIRQAIAGGVNDRPGVGDGEREPGAARLDLLGHVIVDLPRAVCIEADGGRSRADAAAKESHCCCPLFERRKLPHKSGRYDYAFFNARSPQALITRPRIRLCGTLEVR